jgi:tetratricopeptide (TPR) repeat protein
MLGRWIEIIVLVMVAVSPWLFGGVEPIQEWWLFSALALALILWGLRVLLEGAVVWRQCRVVLCAAAIIYVGFAQLLPLPVKILGAVSPATQRTLEFLLPEQPEALDPEKGDFAAKEVGAHPLTLYRSSTAQTICRLLAALALFALVRNNIPAKNGLLRLSLVAFVNGVALSLLAIFQMFSSPPNEMYWAYKAPAIVFGPFVCRNHFPFYINCCLGLGLGLLIYSQGSELFASSKHENGEHSRRRRRGSTRHSRRGKSAEAEDSNASFLRAETLWIGVGMALMLSAVLLSLSRGGVVVLFVAALLSFIAWGRSLLRLSHSVSGIVIGAAGAFALLSWFGFNLVKERLETLWQGGGLEARAPLWSSCLPLLGQFPLFGTGYGTFQLVEPLHRAYVSEEFTQLTFVHAHNEFIEAMVEGGIFRLLLSLAAIGFVFAAGYRVLRRHPGPSAGLVGGALFAFTTVVLHSIGDFGMHVPAIAILVAVVAAYIMGMADDMDDRQARARGTNASSVRLIRWGGIAPVLAAGLFAGIGFLLFAQSYHWQLVHRFLTAGLRKSNNDSLEQQERRIDYLKTAVALAPTFASTELELAQAYYDAYSAQQNRIGELQSAEEIAATIMTFPSWNGFPFGLVGFPSGLVTLAGNSAFEEARWRPYVAAREVEFEKSYLAPALRYFITARDLCPLLGKPHARIAAHRDMLAHGDRSEQYMQRVRYLRKYDPEVWYISGILELAAGEAETAWKSWRRSLELSDAFLMDISRRSLAVLSTDELIESVLPDKPGQLLRVALELYPPPADKDEREPFLDRALALLEQPGLALTGSEWRLKANALYLAGRMSEARTAFRAAIQYDPGLVDLRIDYARFLHEVGLKREAKSELLMILSNDSKENRALDLLAVFDGEKVAR